MWCQVTVSQENLWKPAVVAENLCAHASVQPILYFSDR